MQADPEASIRTNTCILLGRLGPSLGYNTKRKVLVPAFTRALKDTFVHARVAGLMALMATIECFEVEELANKVIPNMAFAMTDKEKCVYYPVSCIKFNLISLPQAGAGPGLQGDGSLCQKARGACSDYGQLFSSALDVHDVA